MFFPGGIIDAKTAAKRVERSRRAGEFLARDQQGIGGATGGQLGMARCSQFGIQEFQIKAGIVDNQRGSFDEGKKIAGDMSKFWFVAQEIIAQTMHRERFRRHGTFRVDILVIGVARGHVIEQFHRADFHNAVTGCGVEPGRFGIQHDFTH